MGKLPFSNPNPKIGNGKRTTQSASDDASSINRRPASTNDNIFNLNHNHNHSQYVTFNLASYTKKELHDLKIRLRSELEQVRRLKSRIESGEFQLPKKSAGSKKVSGNKRPLPVKDFKRSHLEVASLMKSCVQVLQKLMKHKHGWIFNVPVDAVGMGLHDYYEIIKKPMDLGTVKANLSKNVYATPEEFASDVRLTFNNALTYNPKGHDVYTMAEQLLVRFEELYRPLQEKFEDCLRQERDFDEELQASSWNHIEPERERERVKKKEKPVKAVIPPPVKLQQEPVPQPPPMQQQQPPASSSNPPLVQSPVRTPSPMRAPPVKHVKQPKPKAKDPNKRDMNLEEKHKLGLGLQSLPSEKMEQVVQIIKKRNGHLKQDGDEIELDIEAVDNETLWELDRLVTNWKKMMSKIKRQALLDNLNPNVASNKDNGELPACDKVEPAPVEVVKKPKKVEAAGDEDVDIGDEMPMSEFPPVEIEKDKDVAAGHASSSSGSSSSSSSGSSSSSDSDSGSSSGSDSEADNGQS